MARNHTTAPSRRTRITLSLPELRIAIDALSRSIEDWDDLADAENDHAASAQFKAMVETADVLRNRLLEARDRMD